jgi:hypothetical protein
MAAQRAGNEFTALKIIALVEVLAVVSGLVIPLTPSKTGGRIRIATLFMEDARYLHEFLVMFLLTNLFVAGLALAVWISNRREAARRRRGG